MKQLLAGKFSPQGTELSSGEVISVERCTNCEGQKHVRATEKEEKRHVLVERLLHVSPWTRHMSYMNALNPH